MSGIVLLSGATGHLGREILKGLVGDWSVICISRRPVDLTSIDSSLHDKIIVENALALWTGCILHDPSLFKEFMLWKNQNQDSAIKNADDFVLSGLLFCPEEKIRLDF